MPGPLRAPERQLSSLVSYLDYWSERVPQREAVVDGECRLSYGRLAGLVDRCARAFLSAGAGPGDRIAMLTTPRLEFLIAFLAMNRIGAVWVGLNPRHKLAELEYVVRDCGAKLLLGIERFEERDFREDLRTLGQLPQLLAPPLVIEGERPRLDFFDGLQTGCVNDRQLERAAALLTSCRPICVVYTSGSAGEPKGALLSDHGFVAAHLRWAAHLALSEVRLTVELSIDHVDGLGRPLFALLQGGTVILQRRFDPRATLQCIERERATFWFAELTQWIKCRPYLADYDLSSLEVAGYVGGPLPHDLLLALKAIGVRVFTGYGMTEVSSAALLTDLDTPWEVLEEANVGRPMDGIMARLVTAEGEPVHKNGEGFLQLRGDTTFLGYLNHPEATAGAFSDDGWFCTGDLLRERGDGTFDFIGRADQTFKSGGYNIYPREIELVLESHHQIACAVVVSVPDDLFQSVGHAFVEPVEGAGRPTPGQLRSYCRASLANYKVPKSFTVLDRLPILRNEKVDRVRLGRWALSEHGRVH
ncbi:MAG TPA: class I adenylate-forming enzyme family protein [Solirubrobacteraceae bacterium]|nr:class I adenylate-forming enzyme family protein [Solirubrobacteraceae bacterium]